ncbi:MAG: ATP-binding protein [Armatimonadota bacterium]
MSLPLPAETWIAPLTPAEQSLLLQESTRDCALFDLDPDGRITRWSPAAEQITGCSAAGLLGEPLSRLISTEDEAAGRLGAVLREAAERGRAEAEGWSLSRGGAGCRVRLVLTRHLDESGQPAGYLGLIRRLHAEQDEPSQSPGSREDRERALWASTERYRLVTRATCEVIYDWDLTTDHGIWEGAIEATLGYAPAEVGSTLAWWAECIHPDDRPRVMRVFEEWLQSSNLFWTEEYRYRRADGNYVVVLDQAYAIRDDAGRAVRLLGSMTDITDRKRAEAEREQLLARAEAARAEAEMARQWLALLAEASRTLSSSLEYDVTLERIARLALPDLADWCFVDVLEADGSIRRIVADGARSELAEALARIPPATSPADSPALRVIRTGRPELVPEVTKAHLDAAARSPEHRRLIREIQPRSSMIVPLLARDRPLGAMTFVSTAVGRRYGPEHLRLAQDLATRAALALDNARLYRQLQRADEYKNRFLALLGHELRGPLGVIRNALEILVQLGLRDGPRQRRALETIRRQVGQEARLIDDLLNLNRIASGKLLLCFEAVELGELIRRTADDHRDTLETAGLTLELELPEEPVWVNGDPARLAQVLGNLLLNARKFTDPGGRVTVRLESAAEAHWATVTVRDTGIGIRPEVLPRIFTAFAQDEQHRERSGGLGLGLSLVKGLVELHGGEVWASSEGPGRGSELGLRLPQVPAPAAQAAMPDSRGPDSASPLRVLVVEDQPEAAETVRDLLELFGHEVETAASGPEGVRLARELHPDVVLCDIGLPGMDGYAVAAALRDDPATAGIRLIAVTGFGQEEDCRRGQQAGFDAHLVKPVDPEELRRLLERLTSQG